MSYQLSLPIYTVGTLGTFPVKGCAFFFPSVPSPHFDQNCLQRLYPTATFENISIFTILVFNSNNIIPKHKLFFLHSIAVNIIQLKPS